MSQHINRMSRKVQTNGVKVCVTCWRRACACAFVIALVVGTICLWKSNPFIWIPGDKNAFHEACYCEVIKIQALWTNEEKIFVF